MNTKNLLALFTALFIFIQAGTAQTDEPCAATELTVGSNGICSNSISGCINPPAYTNSTSFSSGVVLPDYSANGFDTATRDFWFKAVVPASGKLNVRVSGGGTGGQTTPLWDMALYTSSDPVTCTGSNFTLVAADSMPADYPDLTITRPAGTVVYIRMWRSGADQDANRCYTICATDPPTAPPGCANTIEPANGSTDVVAPYTQFRWSSVPSASAYTVYLGNTYPGDSLTTVSDTTITLATAYNTKYYYSIVPVNAAGSASGCAVDSFTTMAVPPIPANDSCQGAIQIAASAPENGTTFGATQSMAASTCGSFSGADANDDVWYKFTTVQNGDATVRLINRTGGNFDPVIIGYSGDCNNLTQIACADNTGAGKDEFISFSNLTTNTTYYLRIYGYGPFGTEGQFTLTAAGSALPPAFYRSISSGNWNDVNIWEASTDSAVWFSAALPPTEASKTITIQNGDKVNVSENLSIDETVVQPEGMLTVASGKTLTLLNTGLTLRSNAGSTGMIGQSGGNIAGNVMVERFIPARRAWRLITAPLTTSQTIHDSWQEMRDSIAGYGTHITGGSAVNGFDQSPTNAPSIKVYSNGGNTLDPLPNTFTQLSSYPGYMLFVRGDRTIDLTQGSAAPATNTILRATGNLNMGSQPAIPVAASDFTLIGNPYASPIDFSLTGRFNVPDRFWVWDPKRGTVGQYVMFEAINGYMPLTSGGSYTGSNSLIQTGQAFFVHGDSTNTGSFVIDETAKVATQRDVFKPSGLNDPKLQVNLHFYNPDNTTTLADAAMTAYNDSYSPAVTTEDAYKLNNLDENIAIVRNNSLLTVERRPVVNSYDTMFLKVYNTSVKNYKFEILPTNFGSTNLEAYLLDSYLNTSTAINLAAPTEVNFSITSTAASADPYRFKIVYRPAGTLPVNITSVKAYRHNQGIQVDWNVATERNIQSYVVEKSSNGEQFTKAGEVVPKNNNTGSISYGWFDVNPTKGVNYYRIRSVENTGLAKLSNIVSVRMDKSADIVVYPNPVKNHTFTLQFTDQPKGSYNIQLFNKLGQQVYSRTVTNEGSSSQTIRLNNEVVPGMYDLRISNGDNNQSQKIIIE